MGTVGATQVCLLQTEISKLKQENDKVLKKTSPKDGKDGQWEGELGVGVVRYRGFCACMLCYVMLLSFGAGD
jgi:hypothetical protein